MLEIAHLLWSFFVQNFAAVCFSFFFFLNLNNGLHTCISMTEIILVSILKINNIFSLFRAAILRLLWWEDCERSNWFFYEFHMDHPKTFYQG